MVWYVEDGVMYYDGDVLSAEGMRCPGIVM